MLGFRGASRYYDARYAEGFALECLARGPKGTNLEPAQILFEYVRRKRAESLVDRACIRAALDAAVSLPVKTQLCLNIHASTLGRDSQFAKFLSETAQNYSVPLSDLTLEIVEHTPYWNGRSFLATLDGLRASGVRIALDDFGIGLSNYSMVLDCRPDYIKIDRYLIKGCHRDIHRRMVIESIAQLAWKMGAGAIAEGVEDNADLEAVTRSGVYMVQGNAFSPPLAPSEVVANHQIRGEYSPLLLAGGKAASD